MKFQHLLTASLSIIGAPNSIGQESHALIEKTCLQVAYFTPNPWEHLEKFTPGELCEKQDPVYYSAIVRKMAQEESLGKRIDSIVVFTNTMKRGVLAKFDISSPDGMTESTYFFFDSGYEPMKLGWDDLRSSSALAREELKQRKCREGGSSLHVCHMKK